MSLKMGKTVAGSRLPVHGFGSLSARMRAWMSEQKGLFTVDDIYAGISAEAMAGARSIVPVQDALSNFVSRREVLRSGNKKRNRLQYFYNHDWAPKKRGKINRKIYKAMRLISFEKGFSANDVQRLADVSNIVTVHKLIKKLLTDGFLRCEGARKIGVRWKQKMYRVVDTDRFHKELILCGHEASCPYSCKDKGAR